MNRPTQIERLVNYGSRTPLVGILTYADTPEDANEAPRTCVLVLNAGIVRKTGPSRLNVALARHIATGGVDAFRFDFAGVGDSPARTDGKNIADGVIADVRDTMDHLEKTMGYERFIVAGLCSGADNGMRAAEQDDRIVGVAMFDPTIDRTFRWYWESIKRKLNSSEYLKSIILLKHPLLRKKLGLSSDLPSNGEDDIEERPELYQVAHADRASIAACLSSLISRDVELFVVFTGSWDFIYNYEMQFLDVYSGITFGEHLELYFMPDADHSFLDADRRKALVHDLTGWCQRVA